jgi:diphosphomevalonate decarboxylase
LPMTVAVIRECQRLREEGLHAWETLDAGPQVKILCLEPEVEKISRRLTGLDPSVKLMVAFPGQGPRCDTREL